MLVGGSLRLLLVGWRIILVAACLACSAGNFCLLQKPELFDLAIGTAETLWQAFWVVYAAFSLEYFVVKAVSHMKM